MNAEKAVELNQDVRKSLLEGKRPDHADAVALGLEALHWIILCRVTNPGFVPQLLHGETEK